MSNVRFGVEIPTFAGGAGTHRDVPLYERLDWKTAKSTALLADRLGYDSIWMADHFILGRDGEMFEIWTAMSALVVDGTCETGQPRDVYTSPSTLSVGKDDCHA